MCNGLYTVQYKKNLKHLSHIYNLHFDNHGVFVRSDEVRCSDKILAPSEPFKYYLREGDWLTYCHTDYSDSCRNKYGYKAVSVMIDEEIRELFA